MSTVPPLVGSYTAGGPAYLIAWERMPDGTWGAHIAWVVLEGEAWMTKSARVGADDVERIEGQRYESVPRRA